MLPSSRLRAGGGQAPELAVQMAHEQSYAHHYGFALLLWSIVACWLECAAEVDKQYSKMATSVSAVGHPYRSLCF